MHWIDSASSVGELAHTCAEHLELRERQKGTGFAYAWQCTFCGEAKGPEVAKHKVVLPVPVFDKTLNQRYESKRVELARRDRPVTDVNSEVPSLRLQAKLTAYLAELTEEFGPLMTTKAVHSVLNRQREDHVSQRPTRWDSEEQLSAWLARELSTDFEILREVPGRGYIYREKRNVRIDFIIRAKQHLIDKGCTDQYFGIEVKFFDFAEGKGFTGNAAKGIFQALSYWYSGAEWDVGEAAPVGLAGVLLFSNLSFPDEREHLFKTYDRFYWTLWRSYNRIATEANVGELLILDYGSKGRGWSMCYNGARYFSRFPDRGPVLGNSDLINKRRIGNAGRKKPYPGQRIIE